MNRLFIDANKKLTLRQDGRFYYNPIEDEGENNFAHIMVTCPKKITENDVAELDAELHCLVATVDNDVITETVIPLTLTVSEDEDIYTSQLVTLTDEVLSGVGKLQMFIEFEDSTKLGMTNSVSAKIYDVTTNSSEEVYPKIGNDLSKLDECIERQSVLNGKIGDLIG